MLYDVAGAAGGALPAIGAIGKVAVKPFQALAKRRVGEQAKGLYQKLLGKVSHEHDKRNRLLANNLRAHHKAFKTISNENYGQLESDAKKAGFIGMKNPILQEKSSSLLDNLINEGTLIKDDIKEFKNVSSFKNAHELQKELGKRLSMLTSEGQATSAFRMGEARKALITDIKNSFIKNKHPELGKKYEEAAEFHLKNVIPYKSEKWLQDVVKKTQDREIPRSVASKLTLDREHLNRITGHLSRNEKDLILADAFKASIVRSTPKKLKVNPEKLINSFYSQQKDFGKFIPERLYKEIDELERSLVIQKRIKKIAGYAGLTGLLGGAYHHFGE